MTDKIHIILDIDGTLINYLDSPNISKSVSRPHLKTFLSWCFDNCGSVSIWTAASKIWYDKIYDKHLKPILDELKCSFLFVYTDTKCSTKYDSDPETDHPESIILKPLKKIFKQSKLPHNVYNTLIVDDTCETYTKNYGNAIPIKTYTGNDLDNELVKLIELLKKLKDTFNTYGTIRKIDKRNY